MARAVLALCSGPINGLVDGAKSIYLNGTALQNADGSYNFAEVGWATRQGYETQEALAGFPVETPFDVAAKLKTGSPVIRTVTDNTVDAVSITLLIEKLFFGSSSYPLFVEYAFDVKTESSAVWTTVHQNTYVGLVMTGNEIEVVLPRPAGTNEKWQWRARKLTQESNDSRWANDLAITRFTEIIYQQQSYPGTALVGLLFDAGLLGNAMPTPQFDIEGSIVRVPSNYDPRARTYSPAVWDGSFKWAWSDNPVWCLFDLLTDDVNGLGDRYSDADFDLASFYDTAVYCDQPVPVKDGVGNVVRMEPRFRLGLGVMQSAQTPDKWIDSITHLMRANLMWNGQFVLKQDRPTTPSRLVTRQNVLFGSYVEKRTAFTDRHTEVNVSYQSEDQDWQLVTDTYEASAEALATIPVMDNPVTVDLWGCSSPTQAERYAKWLLDTELYQAATASWTMERAALDFEVYDVVKFMDSKFNRRKQDGRIVSISGKTVVLDRPITLTTSGSSIDIATQDGSYETLTITQAPGTYSTLTLDRVMSKVPHDQAVFMVTTDIGPRLFRITKLTENGPNLVDVEAVVYDPNKFARVEGTAMQYVPPVIDTSGSNLPKVTDIFVFERKELIDGVERRSVQIEWQPPADALVMGYAVRIQMADGPWQTASVDGPQYMLRNVVAGDYRVEIAAQIINSTGVVQRSPWEGHDFVIGEVLGTTSPLAAPQQLKLINPVSPGSTDYNDNSLAFSWIRSTSDNTQSLPLKKFRIQFKDVATQTVFRTEEAPAVSPGASQQFTYQFDLNKSDGGGTPRRAITVSVMGLDFDGLLTAPATQTFTNPAPAAVGNIAVAGDIGKLQVTFDASPSPDAVGYMVWVGTTNNFVPSGSTLRYNGKNTHIFIDGLDSDKPYWVRVAAFDSFAAPLDGAGLNVSGTYMGQPLLTIRESLDALQDGLDAEVAALEQVDAANAAEIARVETSTTQKIAKETTDRAAALTAESQARAAALTAEQQARTAAIATETTNRTTAIQAEATARANALTQESTNRTNAINSSAATLQAQISTVSAQVADITGADTWTSSKTYPVGDLVVLNGVLYRSLQASNSNKNPATQTAWWEKIGNYASLGEAVSATASLAATTSSRVTTAEGAITTTSNALTALTNRVTSAESTNTNQTNALTSLDTRVTSAEGSLSSQAGQLTSLTTRITNAEGVGTSQGNAITSLETRVTNTETTNTSQGSSISNLSNTLITVQGNIANLQTRTARMVEAGASALLDGGFENYINNVSVGSGGTIVSTGMRSGNRALQLTGNGTYRSFFFDKVTTQGNRVWYAEGWVKASTAATAGAANITVRMTGGTGFSASTVVLQSLPVTSISTSAWSKLSGYATVPVGATGLEVYCELTNGVASGAYLFDDFFAADVTEAKAASDLALTKADASAVTALTTRVTNAEGTISSQGGSITSLTNRITAAEGVNTTQTTALSSLDSRVTAAEGVNTSQASALTAVSSAIGTMRNYRIEARGAGTSNYQALGGLWNTNNTRLFTPGRSWNYATFDANGDIAAFGAYDVFGNAATAQTFADVLNALPARTYVVIFSFDEPQANLTTALRQAIVSCGGSMKALGSLAYRGAYVLVGQKGLVEGAGIEHAAPTAATSPDSIITLPIQLVNGRILGVGDSQGAALSMAAANSAISGLDTRVTSAEGTINSTNSALTTLTNRVTNAEGVNASQANALSSLDTRITAAEGVNTTQTSSLTSLTSRMDNLNVGATNLLDGTRDWSGATVQNGGPPSDGAYQGLVVKKATGPWTYWAYPYTLKAGQTYTLTFWGRGAGADLGIYFFNGQAAASYPLTADWVRYKYTWTQATDLTTTIRVESAGASASAPAWSAGLKLELGSVPSGWSPSAIDLVNTASAISGLDTRITSAEGSITSTSNALTALTNRVTNAEGTNTSQTSAISGLETRVTNTETTNTAQANSITSLTSGMQAAQQQGTSLIPNGRFLQGLTGWLIRDVGAGNGSITYAANSGKNGAPGLTFVKDGSRNPELTTSPNVFAVRADRVYQVRMVGKGLSGTPNLTARLYHRATGTAWAYTDQTLTFSTADHEEKTANFPAVPAWAVDAYLSVYCYPQVGSVILSVLELNDVTDAVALSGQATALSNLTTRVTSAEGVNTSQAGSITSLTTRMNSVEGVNTTQNTAISGLDTRITSAEGTIAASSTAITNLKSSLNSGGNLLRDPEFQYGTAEWIGDSVNPANWGIWSNTDWNPTGMRAMTFNNNDIAWQYASSKRVPIGAGQRIGIATWLAAHRVHDVYAEILFFDANFTLLSNPRTPSPVGDTTGGRNFAAWKRVAGFFTAPANTCYAAMRLVMQAQTGNTPHAWFVRPMMFYATADQTVAPEWSPSSFGVDAAAKASADAITSLETRVTSAEGVNTTQTTQLTSLTSRMTAAEGVNTSQGTAITDLTTRITAAEGVNTTQSTSLVNLSSTMESGLASLALEGGVPTFRQGTTPGITGSRRNLFESNSSGRVGVWYGVNATHSVDSTERGPDGYLGMRKFTLTTTEGVRIAVNGDHGNGLNGYTYTYSVYIRTADGTSKTITLDVNDVAAGNETVDFKYRRMIRSGMTGSNAFRFMDLNLPPGTYYIGCAQIEYGSSVTAYQDVISGTNFEGSGLPVGSLWYDTSNNNLLRRYNGTAWEDVSDTRITSTAIALNNLTTRVSNAEGVNSSQATSITNLDARLTSAEGVNNSQATALSNLDARVTSAEGVNSSQATAITTLNTNTGRLLTDDGANWVSDPKMESAAFWSPSARVRWDDASGPGGVAPNGWILKALGRDNIFGRTVPVKPGDRIYVACWIARKVAGPNTGLGLMVTDVNGGVTQWALGAVADASTATWKFYSGEVLIADNGRLATPWFQVDSSVGDAPGFGVAFCLPEVRSAAVTRAVRNDLNAQTTALNALTTRVSAAEGVNTAQATSITNLDARLSSAEGINNSQATALNNLDARVTSAQGTLTSTANSLTSLKAGLGEFQRYQVHAWGNDTGNPRGLYRADGTNLYTGTRSYNVVKFNAQSNVQEYAYFDIFGLGQAGGWNGGTPAAFKEWVSLQPYGTEVVVWTGDEPASNRNQDVYDALLMLGGSRKVIDQIRVHGAYLLIGRKGMAEGEALEDVYVGTTYQGTSRVSATIDVVNGRIAGLSGNAGSAYRSAAISQELTATTSTANTALARYTLKTDVNGRVAGMTFSNNGETSNVTFKTDTFAIASDSATGTKYPFVVGNVNGQMTVGVDGNTVIDGTVAARHLASDSVNTRHMAAGAVTADKANINNLSALTANMGYMHAGQLNMTWGDANAGGENWAYVRSQNKWVGDNQWGWVFGRRGSDGHVIAEINGPGMGLQMNGPSNWMRIWGPGFNLDSGGLTINQVDVIDTLSVRGGAISTALAAGGQNWADMHFSIPNGQAWRVALHAVNKSGGWIYPRLRRNSDGAIISWDSADRNTLLVWDLGAGSYSVRANSMDFRDWAGNPGWDSATGYSPTDHWLSAILHVAKRA